MAERLAARRLDVLEENLGVDFRDRALLELAFVHSSCLNERPGEFRESNERLEFLGDALIGLVIGHEVYQRAPSRPEGELTALRSALVRGETLARVADSLCLGRFLLMGAGEEASGGRDRESNLAAVFEALVGAVFLDRGYEAARAFVLRTMTGELAAIERGDTPKNPKSLLQETVQSRGDPSPSYRIVSVTGKDHMRWFTAEVLVSGAVLGRGTGRRKALAEREAAKEALKALGHDV